MAPPSGRRLPCFSNAMQVEGIGSIGCDLDGSNGQWVESPVDQPGFEGHATWKTSWNHIQTATS